mmetsp:Transcript_37128/g.58451  ORF Transcript_37128/g.58451 Transcript_37128/m.58451 type:complete len:729 (-) Transcript_37128:41-2227(-)
MAMYTDEDGNSFFLPLPDDEERQDEEGEEGEGEEKETNKEEEEGLTYEEFCQGVAVHKVVLDCLRPQISPLQYNEGKDKKMKINVVKKSEVTPDRVVSKPLSFPHEEMINFLDHDNHETRAKFRTLAADPLMAPRYQQTLPEERQLALDRLQKICDHKLISVNDFIDNPHRIFTAHEMTAYMDGATATKMTVQFNLFGGTVLKIGGGKEGVVAEVLKGVDDLSSIGCFGLTELGYGNNAVEMETTATYDPASGSFILNSPSALSQKYWITNSAIHAKWCVVFSRLIVNDNDEGIHGILVRIREDDMSISKGVTIKDMGHKIGVNGVDNGVLSFNNVKVPRENLLDSTSQVSASGEFTSPIEKKRDRFLTLADQLLSGRLCIASMCLGASKAGLKTAVKYSLSRRALGRDNKSSAKLMSFQLQQRAFMPLIADTYAHNIALNYAKDQFKELQNSQGDDHTKLVILCCALKPLITWSCNDIANTVRERCGGQGYLSINRFGELWAGAHAGMTAEGDNAVLMQKVAKELLGMEKNKSEVAKFMILTSLPLWVQRLVERTLVFGNFSDPNFHLKLFQLREQRAKMMLISRLQLDRIQHNLSLYDSWCHQNQDHVQHFARAHGERVILEQFITACKKEKEKDSHLYPMLDRLCRLYGLSHLEKDIAWFLHEGVLNRNNTVGLSQVVRNVCAELSEYADELVEGFGVPQTPHEAPIQGDWEGYNEWDNQGEHKR